MMDDPLLRGSCRRALDFKNLEAGCLGVGRFWVTWVAELLISKTLRRNDQ